jgi:hypothetical protein
MELTASTNDSIIILITTGTAMKTNKELNQAYDAKQRDRMRPAPKEYNWQPLEAVIRQWILQSK